MPDPINKLDDYVGQRVTWLDDYQRIATGTAIYPGQGTPLGLAYVALKMNGEAGEFAEHVGKAMRDDDLIQLASRMEGDGVHRMPILRVEGALTPERRALLIKEAGDVLWYVAAACSELGISLSDAANGNLKKLYDRLARGVLQGSGDTR